jgi:hypothetical protein
MRAALFWTPPPHDPLTQAANIWLGRDPERNIACPQPDIRGLAAATETPRWYGFHATLRPPMRLATSWHGFHAAAGHLASTFDCFDLPPLEVAELDGFLALCTTSTCHALHALADACIRETEPHRNPPTEAELARRRKTPLSANQEKMLGSWGYPYVMSEWRFHMTLTRRLDRSETAILLPAARAHFAQALIHTRRVEDIAIFTQIEQAPFLVAERLPLYSPRRHV